MRPSGRKDHFLFYYRIDIVFKHEFAKSTVFMRLLKLNSVSRILDMGKNLYYLNYFSEGWD